MTAPTHIHEWFEVVQRANIISGILFCFTYPGFPHLGLRFVNIPTCHCDGTLSLVACLSYKDRLNICDYEWIAYCFKFIRTVEPINAVLCEFSHCISPLSVVSSRRRLSLQSLMNQKNVNLRKWCRVPEIYKSSTKMLTFCGASPTTWCINYVSLN